MASDNIHSLPEQWLRTMLLTMRFILVAIILMNSQLTREGLLARMLSWIPGMVPYRYSIAGLFSSRYLKEWIRYAKHFKADVRRCFPLILQWICASRRARAPFWLFFVQVMHFCTFRLVNSVSTSPSFDLIDCTPALQSHYNICARHSMANRVLGGEKTESLVYFDSSASLQTRRFPPPSLVIPKIFASNPKFSTTSITDKYR